MKVSMILFVVGSAENFLREENLKNYKIYSEVKDTEMN